MTVEPQTHSVLTHYVQRGTKQGGTLPQALKPRPDVLEKLLAK